MLHLTALVLLPMMTGMALGAPAPQSVQYKHTSTSTSTTSSTAPAPTGQNSTSITFTGSVQPGRSENQTLISQLELAATAVDRAALLPYASDHLFDFNNPPSNSTITTGLGGHLVTANRKAFPALIGNGASMSVGFVGPCGFNTPHVHPRGTELNIVVEGTLEAEHIIENGGTLIRNRLSQYQMSVFPQGAIHTGFNPECSKAVFVAAFPNEDAGVSSIAQRLFSLDDDVLRAEFGSDLAFQDGRDLDQFRAQIPENIALGVESCLQKCGIAKR